MKTQNITTLKKLLWKDFSIFIRLRDALLTTGFEDEARCVTCGRVYNVKKMQAGHFIPGRKNAYLYDLRQVHAQCYGCNIEKGGNWPEYRKFMVDKYGAEAVDRMENHQRHEIVKFTPDYLINKRNYIKACIQDLKNGGNPVDNLSDKDLPF